MLFKRLTAGLMSALTVMPLLFSSAYAADEDVKTFADKKAQTVLSTGAVSVRYALLDDGEITLSGSAGVFDKSQNRALDNSALYGAGSVSKLFVTAAVLKLAQEKKLDLDAPVTDYIPNFTMADERYRKITPRMLLNHSSGLLGSSMTDMFLYNDSDTFAHDHLLETLKTQRLKAEPGAYSVYCNDGFTLAELLVERVSGVSFTSYIRHAFLNPLEMTNTYTPLDSFDHTNLARVYVKGYEGALPYDTVNTIGTGGIYTTPEDLCQFAKLFTGGSDILDEKSLEAMSAPEYEKGLWHTESDSSIVSYGLGWDSVGASPFDRYGIKAIVKGGDTLQYSTALVVLPKEGMAAAVTSSGGSSLTNQLLATELLLNQLEHKGLITGRAPDEKFDVTDSKLLLPAGIKKLAGIYISSLGVMKTEITEDNVLKITQPMYPSLPAQEYAYMGNGNFISQDRLVKVRLETAKNGKAYLYMSQYLTTPGFSQIQVSQYIGQRAEENKIPEDVSAVWKERGKKLYMMENQKYSSQFYLLGNVFSTLPQIDALPGYVMNQKITDRDHAIGFAQIPLMAGRDTLDMQFINEDGKEYLITNGMRLTSSDNLSPIYTGPGASVTIQDTGYARWYLVGGAAGKSMTVTVPDKAAFVVYDKNASCVFHSLVMDGNTATLPEGGYLVFIGSPKSIFRLAIR